jgi:hypothetical protein
MAARPMWCRFARFANSTEEAKKSWRGAPVLDCWSMPLGAARHADAGVRSHASRCEKRFRARRTIFNAVGPTNMRELSYACSPLRAP